MEVLTRLLALSPWEKLADLHGLLSMAALILLGADIALFFTTRKADAMIDWLKRVLLFLFVDLALLDLAGLTVYMQYRAEGGPRSLLLASESTAWLHQVVFEHKEFLAFAPPLIILAAYLVTRALGKRFNDEDVKPLRRSVGFALGASLVLVLLVAAEAVLVTKVAPVK